MGFDMPQYLSTSRQKLTAAVLIIILIILIWQIYSLFSPSTPAGSVSTSNVSPKVIAKNSVTPSADTGSSVPAPASTAPVASLASKGVMPSPNGATVPPVENAATAEDSMDPAQRKYLKLLQEYKLLELQKSIAADKQAIINSQLSTMEAVNKLNGMGGQAQALNILSDDDDDTAATSSKVSNKKFALQYTGLEDGEWVATLKYGNNAYDVKIGTMIGNEYKVTHISNNGVTLTSSTETVELGFDDAVVTAKKDVKKDSVGTASAASIPVVAPSLTPVKATASVSVTAAKPAAAAVIAKTPVAMPVQAATVAVVASHSQPTLTPVVSKSQTTTDIKVIQPSKKITPAEGSAALAKHESEYMHNPEVARVTEKTAMVQKPLIVKSTPTEKAVLPKVVVVTPTPSVPEVKVIKVVDVAKTVPAKPKMVVITPPPAAVNVIVKPITPAVKAIPAEGMNATKPTFVAVSTTNPAPQKAQMPVAPKKSVEMPPVTPPNKSLLIAQQPTTSSPMEEDNTPPLPAQKPSQDDVEMPMLESSEVIASTPNLPKPKVAQPPVVAKTAVSPTVNPPAHVVVVQKAPEQKPAPKVEVLGTYGDTNNGAAPQGNASQSSPKVFNQAKNNSAQASTANASDASYLSRFKNWMRGDEADALPTKN